MQQQLHTALVIAKKDVRIQSFNVPVITFGLIFPMFFFFLAFAIGRPVVPGALVLAMLAMRCSS